MSAVVALVILSGAACFSPVEQAPRETVAYQTPCAIVIREQTANPFKIAQQPNTITPASATLKATAKAKPKFKYPPSKKKPKKKRKARR